MQAVTRETQNAARAQSTLTAATNRTAENIRKLALTSANALRVSTDQASRLRDRLLSVGDTAGLAQLEAGLNRLRTSLINATSGLDVREARAGYADLASELNRTARESERLRAETIQVANAQEQATREADQRTAALNRLRAAHDPLFATSQRYEQALREIQTLESAGALSAGRAAMAREQASQSLLAASAANTGYARTAQASTFHTANMAAQFNDIGVMLASGQSPLILAVQQGTQISQVLNQMGNRASVLSTLRAGFASMVSPVSLLTIGVIAGGAALIQWAAGALGASEETQSFSDALSNADSAITTLRSATDALAGGNLERLREQYGAVNLELDAHLERLRKVAELEAGMANSALIDSIRGELTSDGNLFTNDVDAVRRAFETTNDRARTLLDLMNQVKTARTFQEQADAVTRLRQAVESTTGGLDRAEGSAAGVLTQLVRSEDAALRLLAAQNGTTGATDNAAAAASNLAGQVGTAANEAARLLANLGSAPAALNAIGKSVQEQIGEIQAQNKSLNLQISQGLNAATANRRVQLDTVLSDSRARGENVGAESIAPRLAEIAQLEQAATEQERLRKQLSEANRPARKSTGGGGAGKNRVESLGDEERQLKRLIKEMNNRTFAIGVENEALQLVISGAASSVEVGKLMIAAQREGAGVIDGQTAAMIRQYDAAQQLNRELQSAATQGAKAWLKAVPTYAEAGRMIEEEVLGSLSAEIANFAKTGEFNFARLADSILNTMADLAAQLAVKELFGDALSGGGGGGGFLAGLFGGGGGDGGFLAGLFGAGSEGGISGNLPGRAVAPISAFRHAPHFSEGTANTSGIPAILHDNEAVIPLSKGRKVPVEVNGGGNGGAAQMLNYSPTYNIQTPDADSFRRSQNQTAADGLSAAQRALRRNG
ncbi:phage tail length tape measure family protein [Roseovarius mucosus]|uniref:phage tail length tape measure family protein n=1 Tax=Roseovarius mucosus TaxID=215743 RepID=UPI0035CF188F